MSINISVLEKLAKHPNIVAIKEANGNIGKDFLLSVIPMVIVGGTSMAGGKGGMVKTIFGVILLSMVYNAMTFFNIPAMLQPFVKGLILCVVVVVDKYMERRHEKV